MVKGLKALKITSLQRVVKRFLHSNYTRWVKKPKFTYISFLNLFQLSQLGLKLDVSDIFDPSKSVMATGIRTQFPVSPKDVSYKDISSVKGTPGGDGLCILGCAARKQFLFCGGLQNLWDTTKLSHDSFLYIAVIHDSEEYLLRYWCDFTTSSGFPCYV